MHKLLFPAFLLILFSCNEVVYEQPQPAGKKSLTSFPESLRGKYYFPPDSGKHPESIIIDANSLRSTDPAEKEHYVLSDSFMLKYYKGFYYINHKVHPRHAYWRLFILKQEHSGDLSMMGIPDKKSWEVFLDSLADVVKVDSLPGEMSNYYSVNPTTKQLSKIQKRFYRTSGVLKKAQ